MSDVARFPRTTSDEFITWVMQQLKGKHARDGAGTIMMRIIRDGVLALDPPGIAVRGLFG